MVNTRSMQASSQVSPVVGKFPLYEKDDDYQSDTSLSSNSTATDASSLVNEDSSYRETDSNTDTDSDSNDSESQERKNTTVSGHGSVTSNKPTQPRRVALAWLRSIRQSGGYQLTSVRNRIGVCFMCNQVKTLSQRLCFGDKELYCGRNCAVRIKLACPKQLRQHD